MNVSDFDRMFSYDRWANRECVRAMQAGNVPDATAGRMAHILAAEKLWLERLVRKKQSIQVWPNLTIEECSALVEEMALAWKAYLADLAPGGLDDKIEYRNSKGEEWSSRVEDVLMHVLMHSTYHRGQIALEMRAAGIDPAYSDFIHAVRQGLVE